MVRIFRVNLIKGNSMKTNFHLQTFASFITIGILFLGTSALAQMRPPGADMNIDIASKNAVIQTLTQELNGKYVFPEVAKKLEKMLRKHQKNGDYDGIASSQQFARTLTEQLQLETHDKHLSVDFSEEQIPPENPNAKPDPEQAKKEAEDELQFMKAVNYGVERVARLPGNVGYLELGGFGTTELVGHAIAAAMTLLNASDALIIDLRKNGGGSPTTVALLASYFNPPETHFTDIYQRKNNTTTQIWSNAYTAGPRYDSAKKVYVLTSKRSFSAAEDFAYTMQSLQRSTTIGEVSGGGAHPGEVSRLHAHFSAFIPFGRSVNSITKTNWEGVGVIPEIKVSAEDALNVAQETALKQLLENEKHPGKKHDVERALDKLKAASKN
jgi:C-terminal processing protease CtpA/Prc